MIKSVSIYSFNNISYQAQLKKKKLCDTKNALELLTSPCFSFVFHGGLQFSH